MNIRNYLWTLLIVFTVICLDQASKAFVHSQLVDKDLIQLTIFFNIISAWNYGVSFGIFNSPETSKWLLIAISVVLISILICSIYKANALQRTAFSFIIGGAIGNVIDRLNYGAVFDFLDFHFQEWHYPTFNVADMFIVVGVAIWLIFHKEETKRT